MNADINTGYVCTHCGSFVKAYSRKLNSSMALVLIYMSKSGITGYFHVENWLEKIGHPEWRADYHKLRFWGLIEAKPGERQDGSKRNGYYKITGRGIMFAEGKLKVQERAVILHNKFLQFEGKEVGIKECLKSAFNYDELMNGFNPKTQSEANQLKQLNLL